MHSGCNMHTEEVRGGVNLDLQHQTKYQIAPMEQHKRASRMRTQERLVSTILVLVQNTDTRDTRGQLATNLLTFLGWGCPLSIATATCRKSGQPEIMLLGSDWPLNTLRREKKFTYTEVCNLSWRLSFPLTPFVLIQNSVNAWVAKPVLTGKPDKC